MSGAPALLLVLLSSLNLALTQVQPENVDVEQLLQEAQITPEEELLPNPLIQVVTRTSASPFSSPLNSVPTVQAIPRIPTAAPKAVQVSTPEPITARFRRLRNRNQPFQRILSTRRPAPPALAAIVNEEEEVDNKNDDKNEEIPTIDETKDDIEILEENEENASTTTAAPSTLRASTLFNPGNRRRFRPRPRIFEKTTTTEIPATSTTTSAKNEEEVVEDSEIEETPLVTNNEGPRRSPFPLLRRPRPSSTLFTSFRNRVRPGQRTTTTISPSTTTATTTEEEVVTTTTTTVNASPQTITATFAPLRFFQESRRISTTTTTTENVPSTTTTTTEEPITTSTIATTVAQRSSASRAFTPRLRLTSQARFSNNPSTTTATTTSTEASSTISASSPGLIRRTSVGARFRSRPSIAPIRVTNAANIGTRRPNINVTPIRFAPSITTAPTIETTTTTTTTTTEPSTTTTATTTEPSTTTTTTTTTEPSTTTTTTESQVSAEQNEVDVSRVPRTRTRKLRTRGRGFLRVNNSNRGRQLTNNLPKVNQERPVSVPRRGQRKSGLKRKLVRARNRLNVPKRVVEEETVIDETKEQSRSSGPINIQGSPLLNGPLVLRRNRERQIDNENAKESVDESNVNNANNENGDIDSTSSAPIVAETSAEAEINNNPRPIISRPIELANEANKVNNEEQEVAIEPRIISNEGFVALDTDAFVTRQPSTTVNSTPKPFVSSTFRPLVSTFRPIKSFQESFITPNAPTSASSARSAALPTPLPLLKTVNPEEEEHVTEEEDDEEENQFLAKIEKEINDVIQATTSTTTENPRTAEDLNKIEVEPNLVSSIPLRKRVRNQKISNNKDSKSRRRNDKKQRGLVRRIRPNVDTQPEEILDRAESSHSSSNNNVLNLPRMQIPKKFVVKKPKKSNDGRTVGLVDRYRVKNEDGSITWGYQAGDGSFKEETIGVDCITRGRYGYVDPSGKVREFTYTSGNLCDPQTKLPVSSASKTGYYDYADNKFVMPDGRKVRVVVNKKNRARNLTQ